MTDQQMSDLFVPGSAPNQDPGFVASVASDIGRARSRSRILALALPATGVLVLSSALYVVAGVLRPVLVEQFGATPQFMGVPAPVALGALAAGLALSARRYVLSPRRVELPTPP